MSELTDDLDSKIAKAFKSALKSSSKTVGVGVSPEELDRLRQAESLLRELRDHEEFLMWRNGTANGWEYDSIKTLPLWQKVDDYFGKSD